MRLLQMFQFHQRRCLMDLHTRVVDAMRQRLFLHEDRVKLLGECMKQIVIHDVELRLLHASLLLCSECLLP